ncbi:hypothetical protein DL765_007168 [Monosporascus sp. GIB2]|nr:hypothetical protein DL765_007168 [Monosporascus sp. GIB2]
MGLCRCGGRLGALFPAQEVHVVVSVADKSVEPRPVDFKSASGFILQPLDDEGCTAREFVLGDQVEPASQLILRGGHQPLLPHIGGLPQPLGVWSGRDLYKVYVGLPECGPPGRETAPELAKRTNSGPIWLASLPGTSSTWRGPRVRQAHGEVALGREQQPTGQISRLWLPLVGLETLPDADPLGERRHLDTRGERGLAILLLLGFAVPVVDVVVADRVAAVGRLVQLVREVLSTAGAPRQSRITQPPSL